MINPEIFREYDIRGVVGEDLTEESVYLIARGFGTYARRKGHTLAVVGRDNRLSSTPFRNSVVRGFTDCGLDVVDVGVVTTPLFYYSRVLLDIDAGIMITGSHNPAHMNGIKMGLGPATIYGEEIQAVLQLILANDFENGQGKLRTVDPTPDYVVMLQEKITLGDRKLKVVVDCGNGTAAVVNPEAIESLGVELIPLFCDSDPTFPNHFPDPAEEKNLEDLRREVLSHKADLGVAFDGDGDRLGVVDDQGNILWGDTLMALFWREILVKYPGSPAIIEVKCSQALYEEVERLGGKPLFYRTGHSLIKAKMRELDAVFTGEMSGHLFFKDEYFGFDDGLYAAMRLLRTLSHTEAKLSQLIADIPRYPSTPETRVDCPDAVKFNVVEKVRSYMKERYPLIEVDGVRVLYPHGWALVRVSNTQPVLVLRAEAETQAELNSIKEEVASVLGQFPEVGKINW